MRRAIVSVNFELWKLISSRPGYIVKIESNDVPPDAECVDYCYNVELDEFQVILQSPSLPEASLGCPFPRLQGPQFRLVRWAGPDRLCPTCETLCVGSIADYVLDHGLCPDCYIDAARRGADEPTVLEKAIPPP